MARAWKRVKANKGSAGVDGRTVQDSGEYLKVAWPDIRARLLDGSCRPDPVRRVGIPKPGAGMRELGIPTVADRLIQQALLQVLQPHIDPTFSEHSHGFRPGRSAHGAVLEAQQYLEQCGDGHTRTAEHPRSAVALRILLNGLAGGLAPDADVLEPRRLHPPPRTETPTVRR